MDNELSTRTPKVTESVFKYLANCYVVPEEDKFHYYPIKIDKSFVGKNFLRFEKTPPVLVDGYVTYARNVFEVTVGDLLRGIVRISRKVDIKELSFGDTTTGDLGGTTTSSEAGVKTDSSTVQHQVKPGLGEGTELEEYKGINAAWEDEIGSLLHLLHSKEGGEWEVSDSVQPKPVDANRSVQNPNQDTEQSTNS